MYLECRGRGEHSLLSTVKAYQWLKNIGTLGATQQDVCSDRVTAPTGLPIDSILPWWDSLFSLQPELVSLLSVYSLGDIARLICSQTQSAQFVSILPGWDSLFGLQPELDCPLSVYWLGSISSFVCSHNQLGLSEKAGLVCSQNSSS